MSTARGLAAVGLVAVGASLAACSTCCPCGSRGAPVPEFDRETERIAVFEAVLERKFPRDRWTERLVVATTLRHGQEAVLSGDAAKYEDLLADRFPLPDGALVIGPGRSVGANAGATADWGTHLSPVPTPRAIRSSLPIDWLTDEEWGGYFGTGRDLYAEWARFDARHPLSSGRIELSDVGFSPSGDAALLFVSRIRGARNGFGAWALLKRDSGRWCVTKISYGWFN